VKVNINVPNDGTCDECHRSLSDKKHQYTLSVEMSSKATPDNPDFPTTSIQGLGTYEMNLCPECMRSFVEQYGIAHPELVAALHVLNQEETNPV